MNPRSSLLVLLSVLILFSCTTTTSEAFSSVAKTGIPTTTAFTTHNNAALLLKLKSTQLYSSSGEGEASKEEEDKTTPTPMTDGLAQQSQSFSSEPVQPKRLDPLVASLTRMDDDMVNTPTTKVPLLGEVPLDGSIVVLLPVALIAIVGFIMSINIAFNSSDAIVQKLEEVNTVLSTPPAKENTITEDSGCRGLCSNQDEQLDNMRNFMNSLAPKGN